VTVLSIDTASAANSVALVEGERVLASLSVRRGASLARPVLGFVDLVLSWTGCRLADLQGLVVNVGPGTFTGLRVGLAVAQGLAMASDKPLVGYSTFEALVALVPEWEGVICPVLEARRGEVYAAFYRQRDGVLTQTARGMVVTPETLCALVTERTLFLGSGVRVYGALLAAELGRRAVCWRTGMEEAGIAVSLARLGSARLRTAESEMFPTPQPLYIRPADARLPRHVARAGRDE
jgi:tRNA threonylcarbamoyladenosine biosynthesis protein TsaB